MNLQSLSRPLGVLTLLVPLAVEPACAVDAVGDENTAHTSDALNAHAAVLWPMNGASATVSVCWLDLDLGGRSFPDASLAPDLVTVVAANEAAIRANVEREWNTKTVLKFVGWGSCKTAPADVQLQPMSSLTSTGGVCAVGQPCAEGFGTGAKGKRIYLNVLFGEEMRYWARAKMKGGPQTLDIKTIFMPAQCQDASRQLYNATTTANLAAFDAVKESCLQHISLHEFGHIAGFAHEQFRPDITQTCVTRLGEAPEVPNDGSEGDTPLGGFDEESIMSYCRVEKSPTLTQQDVAQTNDVYAKLAPKVKSDPPPSTSSSSGGANDDEPSKSEEAETPKQTKKPKTTTTTQSGGCG